MKLKATLILMMIFGALSVLAQPKITCTIKGKVENRTSKALFLMKATSDPRTEIKVRIPIVDNTFEYTISVDEQEAYQLIFEEEYEAMAYKPVIFFPDTTEVRLVLNAGEKADDFNKVFGGKLNRSYSDHLEKFASTFKSSYMISRQKRREAIANKSYYSLAYDSLKLLLKTADKEKSREISVVLEGMQKDGSDLSDLGKTIKAEERQIIENMYALRYQYIKKNATPVSYYMVYEDLHNHKEDSYIRDLSTDAYDQLMRAMPRHPYTIKVGYLVSGLRLNKGMPLVDFIAPDLNGQNYRLSSLIKGKVTLLDLWASWCGPCITKTREVMPFYSEFKSKGFQIIGVAREFKNLENLKAALKRERHPWLTLVDLEDKQLIWNKYGLSQSGGGMVLLDEKGLILAINPTTEEIKKIVKQIIE